MRFKAKFPIKIRHISYALICLCLGFGCIVLYDKVNKAIAEHFSITELSTNDKKVYDIIEEKFFGKNLLFTSFADIESILRANLSFNHLHVRKHLPDGLVITISNITPVAYLKNTVHDRYFDENGREAFIQTDGALDTQNLIEIQGKNAEFAFPEFLKHCGSLALCKLSLVDTRRWNITLKSGVTIKLPKENYEEALIYLPKLLNSDNLSNEIVVVDLRAYPQKIYLSKK